MSIKDVIRNNALAYEIGKKITCPVRRVKYRKKEREFSNYSVKQLMEYDANMYMQRQGETLDWSSLNTYTEKMQYEKIFNHDPRKARLADKYAVRQWVADLIGEEYLIPLIGAWDNYSDIDFKLLPNQFVIKTNHGSCDVVVIKDKISMKLADRMRMKRIIDESMHTDYAYYACEMHYAEIKPKIIAEQYIDSGESDLQDYKFLCFDGVPYYCWADVGRYHNHKRNVYDLKWKLQDWNQFHYGNYEKPLSKPENFEKMIDIVKILSAGFAHVRVDLYNVAGKIYFGEMTFTNGSGFEEITPKSANVMLGKLWNIDTTIKIEMKYEDQNERYYSRDY